MKTLRLIGAGLFAILICFVFTSCSDEDLEKDEESNDDMTTKINSNGRQYIDIGLSALWATCNVGSFSPTDMGNKYAFGEKTPKSEYTSSNYVGGDYDIAKILWGGDWRTPNKNEIEELVKKCSWKIITKNGIELVQATGPNGNCIELPYSSYLSNGEGIGGWYWSSTSYSYTKAYCLHFDNDVSSGTNNKYNGFLIRPVITNPSHKEGSAPESDENDNTNTGGSSSQYEKPDVGFYDFTATRSSIRVQYKIYNKNEAKVSSAQIYYGTSSNPTKNVSTNISGTLITANISGLESGTTYYVKCKVTGAGGSTTTSVTKCTTNY